jgi:NifU-like protein involved in Fe-S cluster formation
VRIKCALLPLKTLKAGVYQYLGAQMEDEEV